MKPFHLGLTTIAASAVAFAAYKLYNHWQNSEPPSPPEPEPGLLTSVDEKDNPEMTPIVVEGPHPSVDEKDNPEMTPIVVEGLIPSNDVMPSNVVRGLHRTNGATSFIRFSGIPEGARASGFKEALRQKGIKVRTIKWHRMDYEANLHYAEQSDVDKAMSILQASPLAIKVDEQFYVIPACLARYPWWYQK